MPNLPASATTKLIESFGQGEGHYERADGSEFHLRWCDGGDCRNQPGWYWWNVGLCGPCGPTYRQLGDKNGPYFVQDRAFRAAVANDPEASDA